MNGFQLENLALRVAERVVARQPIEDSYIELKATWPTDSQKVARRIAAHANEMRGQPIVWIIGVDDDAGTVSGASKEELAEWWPAVRRFFDQQEPSLTLSRVAHYEDKPIVALLFDTSTFPYVVTKGDGPGAFEREVPMREGTRTRSARRSEIVRLFTPEAAPVSIEIHRCLVTGDLDEYVPPSGGGFHWWTIYVAAFATVRGERPVYLPAHGFRFAVDVPGEYDPVEFVSLQSLEPAKGSVTVQKTGRDLLISHAGWFVARGEGVSEGPPPSSTDSITLRCEIHQPEAPRPLLYSMTIERGLTGTRTLTTEDTAGYTVVSNNPQSTNSDFPFRGPQVRIRRWHYSR